MRIHTDHLYHGAALIQIAEDPQFTAINSLRLNGLRLRSAFKINDNIGVHLKYASKPSNGRMEYVFTFSRDERSELASMARMVERPFVALVCVKAGEICCLRYEEVCQLFDRRRAEKGVEEDQYVISVTVQAGRRLRAFVKAPGKRGMAIGEPLVIERCEFPRGLFILSKP